MIKAHSKAIYRELINGKVINKHVYLNGAMQENNLYDELVTNHDAYKQHYAINGFELSSCGEAFFLREDDMNRYKDTPALKIQAILFILSKFCSEMGTRVEALFNYKAGLKRSSIDAIGQFDEVNDILKACDMKGALASEIDNNWVSRGIAFWNQSEGLVLTDGGKAIFDQMFRTNELSATTYL